MTNYFTSDSHFGHENIIKLCQRPFTSVQEMDETLIANWNKVVKPEDNVYHLGDVVFRSAKPAKEIVRRLNGRIFLLEGNHDEEILSALPLPNWTVLPRYEEVKIGKQRIVLSHYAMRTWHHDLRGVWHLYGHSHGNLPPLGKSCDIGVDCWNFVPVSFDRLKEYMDTRPMHNAPKFEGYVPDAGVDNKGDAVWPYGGQR